MRDRRVPRNKHVICEKVRPRGMGIPLTATVNTQKAESAVIREGCRMKMLPSREGRNEDLYLWAGRTCGYIYGTMGINQCSLLKKVKFRGQCYVQYWCARFQILA